MWFSLTTLFVQVIANLLRDTDGVKEYREIFDAIDVDRTGFITHEEFLSACDKHPNLLASLFETLDMTGDGKIAYNEFLAATLNFKDEVVVDENSLIEAFDFMDKSSNGVITAHGLAIAMSISQDAAREMLYEAVGHREDPDPQVTLHQFVSLIRQDKQNTSRRTSLIWMQNVVNFSPSTSSLK